MNFHLFKIEDVHASWWVSPARIAAIGPATNDVHGAQILLVGGGIIDLFIDQDAVLEQIQEAMREYLGSDAQPITSGRR